jgi:hypothetical protein
MVNLSEIIVVRKKKNPVDKNADEEYQNVTRKINPNLQRIYNPVSRRL